MPGKKAAHKKTASKPEPKVTHPDNGVLGFLEKKLHEKSSKEVEKKKEMLISAAKTLSQGWNKSIETDYDKILQFVRSKKTVRMKEISKELKIRGEIVEEKIKILEENNLVELKYPAIGGAIITFKEKKEE